jgi:hypothetical protein
MRARPVVLLTAGLLLVAGACSDSSNAGGKSEVDTGAPASRLAAAVQAVRSDLPVDLPRSSVEVLLQDLCALGPSGAASAVASQLAPLALDAGQGHAVLAALDAGTTRLCPHSVDSAARAAAEAALAPASSTTAPAAVTAASGSGRHGASPSSGGAASSTRSSSSKVSDGPASATGSVDSSGGSASAGGGNASGSGNQSSTSFSQDVSSSNGASNSGTASN